MPSLPEIYGPGRGKALIQHGTAAELSRFHPKEMVGMTFPQSVAGSCSRIVILLDLIASEMVGMTYPQSVGGGYARVIILLDLIASEMVGMTYPQSINGSYSKDSLFEQVGMTFPQSINGLYSQS